MSDQRAQTPLDDFLDAEAPPKPSRWASKPTRPNVNFAEGDTVRRADRTGVLRAGTVTRIYDRHGLTNYDVCFEQWQDDPRAKSPHRDQTVTGFLAQGLEGAA